MATKNKITDLRDHLFETLEALRDDENPMDIARAKAVADVAGRIIESAKVEVDFLKVTGGTSVSGFIPDEEDPPALAAPRPQLGDAPVIRRRA